MEIKEADDESHMLLDDSSQFRLDEGTRENAPCVYLPNLLSHGENEKEEPDLL